MNCLQANEVVYAYQNKYQLVQALSGVSADFAQGQLYAIIGASGQWQDHFFVVAGGLGCAHFWQHYMEWNIHCGTGPGRLPAGACFL